MSRETYRSVIISSTERTTIFAIFIKGRNVPVLILKKAHYELNEHQRTVMYRFDIIVDIRFLNYIL